MDTLQFTTEINAPRSKVWESLWNDANYREWSAAFMEGSYAETDNWQKGSKVLFLDAERNGMIAVVQDNRPNEFMSFKHLGELRKGVEQPDPDGNFGDNHENYTLKDIDGKTQLIIDMGMPGAPPNFIEYFKEAWPKALAKIKKIAERA